MPLQSLVIEVSSSHDPQYLSDILLELGAISVSVSDLNDQKSNEHPIYVEPSPHDSANNRPLSLWLNSRVTALYPLSYDMESLLMTLATDFEIQDTPTCIIRRDIFDEKDPETWVVHVQQFLQPIVLDRIRITYPWNSTDPNYINLELKPGMAFGTGEHMTTQLCLSWIQNILQPNQRILDFGTGSGVLSIAAAKLDCTVNAIGIDLDPTAIEVANDNAKNNGVENRVSFFENHQEPLNQTYDIVVANILKNPLKQLSSLLVSRLKKGGRLALSGILSYQAENVIECYQEKGIKFEESTIREGWALVSAIKL